MKESPHSQPARKVIHKEKHLQSHAEGRTTIRDTAICSILNNAHQTLARGIYRVAPALRRPVVP